MARVKQKVLTAYMSNLLIIGANNLVEILLQLKLLTDSLSKDIDFASYFYSPYLTSKERLQILNKLLEGLNFDPSLVLLLRLMVENKDLQLLPDLYKALEKKSLLDSNILPITVVTAHSLTKKHQKDFEALAEQIFASKVLVEYKIDNSLVGGLLFISDDLLLDVTFRRKIQILQESFSVK